MIKVTVPATSANLGPGFDAIGIALSIYNTFIVKESSDYEFIGIEPRFANTNNLVIKSSQKTFDYLHVKEIKYSLEIEQKVPIARGLGSSATCIVAGIIIASYLAKKPLSKEEIITIGTEIEGHPDNIAPAVLGSLVSSVKCDKVISNHYDIADWKFTIIVPNQEVRTVDARGVLPQNYSLQDVVYNISRAINLPITMIKGNENELYYILNDKVHQPYRFPLIKGHQKYLEYSKEKKLPFCISGSGSTLLFITRQSIISEIKKININDNNYIDEITVDKKGAVINEK